MILYKKGFEKQNKDTIAVIYELLPNLKRQTVKINKGMFILDDSKKYLIICGLSEWTYGKGNKLEKVYPSINK